ncbi:MAG: arginine--tRNA ligase [Vicinamibacterales bacterium]
MLPPLHDRLRAALRDALTRTFALDRDVETIPLETPPNRPSATSGSPIAFELARPLRKAPKAIALDLAQAIAPVEGIREIVAAPNGYLNVFFDRAAFLTARLGAAAAPPPSAGKTIVEHTAINPNKAAHIGHLRNACLGDTLVRALRFQGVPVEVQNYIDDTGVQVADVVVGLRHLEGLDLEGVRRVADTTRFDYYCWDLYARVTEWYEADKARLAIRAATLHEIEHAIDPSAAIGALVAERIVRTHLVTMGRLGIDYDLLTWEGDILRLQFWARAFESLKATGAVFLQTEGALAGCWVMTIDDDAGATPDPEAADAEDAPREKVIVRSNGTVTYVGKDMAYQFWKLGVLGRDFVPPLRHPPRRGHALGDDQPGRRGHRASPGLRRRHRHRQRHRRAARPTCSSCSSRRSPWPGIPRPPASTRTSPTRWWRCRTRPHASWDSPRPRAARTRAGRSSRSLGGRASA